MQPNNESNYQNKRENFDFRVLIGRCARFRGAFDTGWRERQKRGPRLGPHCRGHPIDGAGRETAPGLLTVSRGFAFKAARPRQDLGRYGIAPLRTMLHSMRRNMEAITDASLAKMC